jgi:hypothetical protein
MKVYDYNQEFGGNYYQARKNDIKTLIKGQFKGDFCHSYSDNSFFQLRVLVHVRT